MMTLGDIKGAVTRLSEEDRLDLLKFVAGSLGGPVVSGPPPRRFSREQIEEWIREDEEDMRRIVADEKDR